MSDTNKVYPQVGDHLYLHQETGNSWIDMVKRPYTVISVSKTEVIVQSTKLIYPVFHYNPETMSEYYKQFDGQRVCFYDTVAESFEEDSNGRVETLYWKPKTKRWGTKGTKYDYPEYAVFGKWEHQPYLD